MTKAAWVRARPSKSSARRRQRLPAQRALDDPALREHVEALRLRALHDLERNGGLLHDGIGGRHTLVAAIGDGALLAFDFLACVVPGRVARGPPFSALFTLWLSTIEGVGPAALPASSRTPS